MKIIDTHMHSIFRPSKFFEEYSRLGVKSVISVAFYPIKPRNSGTLEDLFRWLIDRETARLKEAGISCFCGIGIHPRSIPENLDSKIFEFIEKNMMGRVVALGEIGLEKGTREEIVVLENLMVIAKRNNNFPMIFHTPGKNKKEVTKKLIELIESLEISRGIIDHVSSENIDLALDTKLSIGLTVQKGKLTKEQFIRIIKEYEENSNRFMLNSDLGMDIAHEYIVPEVAQYMVEQDIEKGYRESITHLNAEKLFKFE